MHRRRGAVRDGAALLILIAGLKRAFSLIAGEMAAFQQRFETLLPLVAEAIELSPELGLWSMVVVACSHARPRHHPLIAAIRDMMTRLNINTARKATDVVKSIIWADVLLTTEAEDLILEIESASLTSGT